jgi:hypothetical protein
MRRFTWAVLVLGMLVSASSIAGAQGPIGEMEMHKAWEAYVAAGVDRPSGDFGEEFGWGTQIGVGLRFQPANSKLHFGWSGAYLTNGHSEYDDAKLKGYRINVHVGYTAWQSAAGHRLDLRAGPALQNEKLDFGSISESESNVGADFMAAFLLAFGAVKPHVEVRYTLVPGKEDDGKLNHISLGLGLTALRF